MRFETEEIHLIYTAEIHYTLYIGIHFANRKQQNLHRLKMLGTKKKSTATMYLCQSHFSFFTGACKHLHHASEAADYFFASLHT